MKKKISIPLVALLVAFAFTVAVTAFTRGESLKASTVKSPIDYFTYNASTFNETDYEDASKWSFIGTSNPAISPCPSGLAHPCVVKVDEAQLPAASGTLNTLEKRFAAYLQSLSSASNYMLTSNVTYQKP